MTELELPSGTADRLYVLDYGLFEVGEGARRIGIQGHLIQTGGRNLLVDLGFPPKYATDPVGAAAADGLDAFGRVVQLGPENLPAGQLKLLDLTPDDVDALILTHTDIDHIGDVSLFGGRRIYVHPLERALDHPRELGVDTIIVWPTEAEYVLVDSDSSIAPGVTLLTTPGHSQGHLSLLLRLPQTGPVLITGDAISRPAELEQGYGNAQDPDAAARSADKLMRIAGELGAFVIYGHDPLQWPTLRKAPRAYA